MQFSPLIFPQTKSRSRVYSIYSITVALLPPLLIKRPTVVWNIQEYRIRRRANRACGLEMVFRGVYWKPRLLRKRNPMNARQLIFPTRMGVSETHFIPEPPPLHQLSDTRRLLQISNYIDSSPSLAMTSMLSRTTRLLPSAQDVLSL